jgi:hypothetical protein
MSGWQASYNDPLRWRLAGSRAELQSTGEPQVFECENEFASVKFVVMHRPTPSPKAESSGQYPFSTHLAGKRRLWELRFQLRLRRKPEGQLFFGVVLDQYISVSTMAKQGQKALVAACQGIVGDCYHTNGDKAARTEGELESPAFVMPLWSFDQFKVSDVGQEPSLLTQDADSLGMKRVDNVPKYIKEMKSLIANLSTDKVYTFGFWGISQFLDVMKWEVTGGIIPGMTFDFNNLCGAPPVYLSIYDFTEPSGEDKRHLQSRKREYFKVEVWSMLKPPDPSRAPKFEEEAKLEPAPAAAAAPAMAFDDLLGLETPVAGSGGYSQPAKPAESQDLLGLM